MEARKKRIDEAEALREGKLKIAWSVIATPESLRRYLYGVNDGVAYEHAMCRIFQDLGFRCRQTKTSGDQGVDLILILNGRKIAIQCKFYSQPVGNAAVQEVYAGMSYYRCDEAWVLTNSSYTAGANKLAGRTGVRLLHHDELKNVLPNT